MGYTLRSHLGNPAESAYRFSNWSFERHTHFGGYFSVAHLAGAPPAEARRSPSPRFLYCDRISPYLDRLLPSIMHVCAHVSYEIRLPEKHGLPTNLWSHSGIDHPSRGANFIWNRSEIQRARTCENAIKITATAAGRINREQWNIENFWLLLAARYAPACFFWKPPALSRPLTSSFLMAFLSFICSRSFQRDPSAPSRFSRIRS